MSLQSFLTRKMFCLSQFLNWLCIFNFRKLYYWRPKMIVKKILVDAMDKSPSTFKSYKAPFIVFQGGMDKTIHPEGAFDSIRRQRDSLLWRNVAWYLAWVGNPRNNVNHRAVDVKKNQEERKLFWWKNEEWMMVNKNNYSFMNYLVFTVTLWKLFLQIDQKQKIDRS